MPRPRPRPRAQGATNALVSVPAKACASLLRGARLSCAGKDSVEPADHQPAFGNEQHSLPIIFEHLPGWWLQPTETTTLGDGALGRLAKIVEIGSRIFGQPIDGDRPGNSRLTHGHQ